VTVLATVVTIYMFCSL